MQSDADAKKHNSEYALSVLFQLHVDRFFGKAIKIVVYFVILP